MKKVLLMAVLALFQTLTNAQSAVKPVADAYVRAGIHSKFNFGSSKDLIVKNDKYVDQKRESYLLFDIGNFVKLLTDQQSVVLKLVIKKVIDEKKTSDFNLSVKVVDDISWKEGTGTEANATEEGISYSNRPAAANTVISELKGAKPGSELIFDVTDAIRSAIKEGKEKISFHVFASVNLADGTTDGYFSFYSRENAKNYPELIIK